MRGLSVMASTICDSAGIAEVHLCWTLSAEAIVDLGAECKEAVGGLALESRCLGGWCDGLDGGGAFLREDIGGQNEAWLRVPCL